MPQLDKIFIPTFISSINYNPARVLPHIYFYNGLKYTNPYYVEYNTNGTGSLNDTQLDIFPYFDNYNGNNPDGDSKSLLFNNETAPYGEIPSGSLYSEYWETYVDLLYSPYTRLIDCDAIIPLADYFQMNLNDIVEWRGNYYHLRAINDYNLSNGECSLQLLGPVIGDTIASTLPGNKCNFDFRISEPATIVLYSYQRGGASTSTYPGFTYVDFNGISRAQETYTFGNSFRFAAVSGSVVDVIGGGTLSVLTNPFNVEFNTVTVTKTSSNGTTAYTGQSSDGQTAFYSESPGGYTRTYCWVSSSANETWDPLNKLTITNGATCGSPLTTKVITLTLTNKDIDSGPFYGVYQSTDGITYTFIQNVTLSSVGATANVSYTIGNTIIKLVDLGACGNEMVHVIPGTLGGDFNIDFSALDFNVY